MISVFFKPWITTSVAYIPKYFNKTWYACVTQFLILNESQPQLNDSIVVLGCKAV
jgi:hypothetical protein